MGEAEKAIHHFEQSGHKASSKDVFQAENLATHLDSCSGAQRRQDWDTLLHSSQNAITMGADSGPKVPKTIDFRSYMVIISGLNKQSLNTCHILFLLLVKIYAMQAEALMELRRHEEAYKVIQEGPNFEMEICTKFLGSAEIAKIMITRTKVYIAAGRLVGGKSHHPELLYLSKIHHSSYFLSTLLVRHQFAFAIYLVLEGGIRNEICTYIYDYQVTNQGRKNIKFLICKHALMIRQI